MTRAHVRVARRNAVFIAASAASCGLLLLYPTSTNNPVGRRTVLASPVGAGVVGGAGSTGSTGSSGSGSATPARGRSGSTGPRASASATGSPAVVTVNGASVDTDYGPVQVQIKVQNGRIVSASAPVYPQDRSRDVEINSYAIPILNQEAVAAQSARIDVVSGASYTTDGYQRSLQSAIDAAHLH
ncbi:MAG: hypothetical protein QOI42_295 [Frankiaceae bacterium]|nr:hypothetical protein [Frankiaceae bacterium]